MFVCGIKLDSYEEAMIARREEKRREEKRREEKAMPLMAKGIAVICLFL